MIKVGLIGFGRMGEKYLTHFQETNRWDVAYICDIDPEARKYAKEKFTLEEFKRMSKWEVLDLYY